MKCYHHDQLDAVGICRSCHSDVASGARRETGEPLKRRHLRATRVATTCAFAALCCAAPVTGARADDTYAPGFSAGIAYTPDDDLTGVGWHAGGSVEHLAGTLCELRGTLGFVRLEGESKAQYGYLIADVLASDLISPTGGVGLYYLDLDAPLEEDDVRTFQFGLNGGVRLFIPYSNHKDRAMTVDVRLHRLFGDGPSILMTLGAGMLF